jgi:D-arginine dehydrogenase
MEEHTGYHASGRSAALFVRNYGNDVLRVLNAASAGFLEEPAGVSDHSILSPRGELTVADAEQLPGLQDYVAGATGMVLLSPAEAREIVPALREDYVAGAAIEWDAQDMDVDRLLAGYTRLLRDRGGRIVTKAKVQEMTRAEGVWRVRAGGVLYEAPLVVNAAGAWAAEIGAMAQAVDTKVVPYRRSAAMIPMPSNIDFARWPMVASAGLDWYARPEGGRLMVSPQDEDAVEAHDAWADDMVLAEGLYRLEQALDIPVTRVEHSWAGLRSFAPDRTPVVGFDSRADGFFWLAGQGGYGIQTSPALSQLTCDLSTGQTAELAPDIVAALDPARFA